MKFIEHVKSFYNTQYHAKKLSYKQSVDMCLNIGIEILCLVLKYIYLLALIKKPVKNVRIYFGIRNVKQHQLIIFSFFSLTRLYFGILCFKYYVLFLFKIQQIFNYFKITLDKKYGRRSQKDFSKGDHYSKDKLIQQNGC